MRVYYSKLDNAICLEIVEQETTAPKDIKKVHTLNHHHKTVSSKQIVKIHYSSLLSISSDHNLKTYIQ